MEDVTYIYTPVKINTNCVLYSTLVHGSSHHPILILFRSLFCPLLRVAAMSSSSSSDGNPFTSDPVAISAATTQLINIKSHVPVTLDLDDSNFGTWCTFLTMALCKFGLMDQVNGSVLAATMLGDA